jgi:hypothetical protein
MAHITESLEVIRNGANRILKFKAGNRSTGSLQFGSDATFSVDQPLKAADGSAGSPSLSFSNSTGVGFYRKTSNVLGIATAGSERATISAGGVLNITSPGYITCATAGTVTTPTTTSVTEYGDGRDHTTVLTLTDFVIGAPGAAAAAKGIGASLYSFPAGVHIEDIQYIDLSLKAAGTAVATATGLGSVVASGVVSVLSGTATFQDRMAGQAITTAAAGGTAVKALVNTTAGMHTGIALNVTGSVKDVFLNSAGTWNANNTGNLTATGTVVLKWTKLA